MNNLQPTNKQFAANNITKRILEWSDDWSKSKKFWSFTFTLSLFKLLARVRMDLDAVFGLSTDCTWTSGAFGLLTEIISINLLHTWWNFFFFQISNFFIQNELDITAIQITCYIQNSITLNQQDKIYLPDRTKSNTNNRGISWRSSCCVMVMTCLMNFLWISSYSSYKYFIIKFYNGCCWNMKLKSEHHRAWIVCFLQDFPFYKNTSST